MRKTQHDRMLECLRSPESRGVGGWVPLYLILDLHIAQYNRVINDLRTGKTHNKKVYNIENKTEWSRGVKHSSFRIVEGRPEQMALGFMGGKI